MDVPYTGHTIRWPNGSLHTEYHPELDGIVLELGDDDRAAGRLLTVDEAFKVAFGLLRDVSLARYGRG